MKFLYKKRKWLLSIGAAVIAGLLLKSIDFFLGTSFVSNSVKALKEVLLYKISILVLIIVAFTGFLLWIIGKRFLYKKAKPLFVDYDGDIFDGVRYRWTYKYNNGQYKISDIKAYCALCNCRIVEYQCPHCNAIYINKRSRKWIEAIIRHSITEKYNLDDFKELKG